MREDIKLKPNSDRITSQNRYKLLSKQWDADMAVFKKKHNKQFEELKNILDKSIYIQPKLFKEIEECLMIQDKSDVVKIKDGNKTFEVSDLQKDDKREFFVLTHKNEYETTGQIQFRVTKKVAVWVKKISQKELTHSIEIYRRNKIIQAQGIKFVKEEKTLRIEGYRIPITPGKTTYRLCKLLLSSKSRMKHKWYWGDIEEKILDKQTLVRKPVNAFNSTVSKLNKRIETITDGKYPKFIDFLYADKTVRVNPDYTALFK